MRRAGRPGRTEIPSCRPASNQRFRRPVRPVRRSDDDTAAELRHHPWALTSGVVVHGGRFGEAHGGNDEIPEAVVRLLASRSAGNADRRELTLERLDKASRNADTARSRPRRCSDHYEPATRRAISTADKPLRPVEELRAYSARSPTRQRFPLNASSAPSAWPSCPSALMWHTQAKSAAPGNSTCSRLRRISNPFRSKPIVQGHSVVSPPLCVQPAANRRRGRTTLSSPQCAFAYGVGLYTCNPSGFQRIPRLDLQPVSNPRCA